MTPALIVALIFGVAIIIWAGRCVWAARRLHPAVRIVAALAFAPVALFCLYGFAAAMEPGDYHSVWRVGYAVVFFTCLLSIVWLVFAKRLNDKVTQD